MLQVSYYNAKIQKKRNAYILNQKTGNLLLTELIQAFGWAFL
jgi:hypothetical protein